MTAGKPAPGTGKTTRRTAATTALSTSLLPRSSAGSGRRERVPLLRHPLLHFSVFLMLGCGCGYGIGSLYAFLFPAESSESPVNPGEPAFPSMPAFSLKANRSDEAVELFRATLIATGQHRLELLRKLAERFPQTPEGKQAATDAAKLAAVLKSSDAAKAATKAKTQPKTPEKPQPVDAAIVREKQAQAMLDAALKEKLKPEDLRGRLSQIPVKFPGTKAAANAAERLKKLPAPQPAKPVATPPKPAQPAANKTVATAIPQKTTPPSAPKPAPATPTSPATGKAPAVAKPAPAPAPKPSPKPKEPEFSFVYEGATQMPVNIFIQRYHDALKDWDLAEAERLADSLSKSQKYPQIRNFGKGCLLDVAELKKFDQSLRRQLEAQKGKEVQLILTKGSKLTGTLSKLDGDKITVLVNNRFPQQADFPLGLNPDYLFSIYTQTFVTPANELNLLKGLFCLAADDEFTARNFLGQLPADGGREKIRELILEQVYGEK